MLSCVEACHHHGHVIGLRPAVDEVDALERLGEPLGEALCVLVDLGVQVDVGRVPQRVDLVVQGRAHPRVAVAHADGDDAREEVEVPKSKPMANDLPRSRMYRRLYLLPSLSQRYCM